MNYLLNIGIFLDTISYPLSKERFPTVTICTNQRYRNFNEWRYIEVAIQMIEDECFKNNLKTKICRFYDSKHDIFIEIADNILKGESWRHLDLASLISMLEYQLDENENEEALNRFHKTLSEMIGSNDGKLSPLAIPMLLFPQKRTSSVIKTHSIKMLFNENCTYEQAREYSNQFSKWKAHPDSSSDMTIQFPCARIKADQPQCCGFFGKLFRENLDFVLLVMNYAIPGFVEGHSELAKHLGFNQSKNYDYIGSPLVPFCEVPNGGSSDMVNCDSPMQRLFWSSDGLCTSFNAPPMDKSYQVFLQPLNIFLPSIRIISISDYK